MLEKSKKKNRRGNFTVIYSLESYRFVIKTAFPFKK